MTYVLVEIRTRRTPITDIQR